MLTSVGADLWLAIRRACRAPGFAVLAVGMLTIGIGSNAAMFALMDGLLFRPPFHVAEPSSVFGVRLRDPGETALSPRTSYPNFLDLKASGAFAGMAAYVEAPISVGTGSTASLANALLTSREFFDVLRPTPHLGRMVSERADNDQSDWALVSYGFWQRHFAGREDVVGASLTIDGRVYTVSGVAPRGFVNLSARPIDLWLPLEHIAPLRPDWRTNRDRSWLSLFGRLASGSTRVMAEERASAVLRQGQAGGGTVPSQTVVTTSIVPGRAVDESLEGRVSLWLAGLSAFVLLIACANVSGLVLTRAFAQRREHVIRVALGASQWHLTQRALADVLVLVVPGSAGALWVSFVLRNGVTGFLSADLPIATDFWDARTAGIMVGSALLAFVTIAGISLYHVRPPARGAGAHAVNGHRFDGRSRRILLSVQACLCFVLLLVAGLFAASVRRVEALDLGVDLDRTIQLTVNLPLRDRDAAQIRSIYERAREVLALHPEVERVALAEASPYMAGRATGAWTAERSFRELWKEGMEAAYLSAVGEQFFSAVGSASLRGRDFDASDAAGAEPVVIINAPLARLLWPSGNAVGQCIYLEDNAPCHRVVGVLNGVWKFAALNRERMAVYVPLTQATDVIPGALFVRPRGDARRFLPQVRALAQSLRPDLPAARAVVVRDIVDPEFRPWRLGVTVFSAFGAVALLITSIGLYGLVAASVALRLKEIGIRIAIGARGLQVIRMVIGESVVAVATGLVAGGLIVAVASRWLDGVLYETSTGDAIVLAETAVILLIVSIVAVIIPTVRALRTNPAIVLRLE